MSISAIAFDLDDTLLDTSGLLVPHASRQAFDILRKHGLKLTPVECESHRTNLIKSISHKDLFFHLAQKFGDEATVAAAELATQAFYAPELPATLPVMDGGHDILKILKKNYALYIVTAGFEQGQNNKVDNLGIRSYFKQVFVVNSLKNDRKLTAFKKILELEKIQPENLLCVGNSLSSEIRDANELGAISCYFEFGEDRGILPIGEFYKPDFHVKNLHDLMTVCRLQS